MKHNSFFKNYINITQVLLIPFLLLLGCSQPKANWMMNPPPEYKPVVEEGGGLVADLTPRAEILFVIDNSKTMEKHLQHVSENIDKFVESFIYKNPLKFNLAVVSAYDFRTFSKESYKSFRELESFREVGEFLPIRTSQGEVLNDKRFISSDDENLTDLLKGSLKIGVQELSEGGPQYEEFFSPIASIYGINGLASPEKARLSHRGFFMGPEAFKIIFFVTDANDSSQIDGTDLYYQLLAKVGGNTQKILTFGAIIPSSVQDANCIRDYSKEPIQIEKFLSLASLSGNSENVVNLCSDFGTQLADFGKRVRKQTLSQVIQLQERPTFSENPKENIKLYYGVGEIPEDCSTLKPEVGVCIPFSDGEQPGFKYNPTANTLHMTDNLEINPIPNATLKVWYIPVNQSSVANGKLNRFGE